MTGPPGTGKTKWIEALARAIERGTGLEYPCAVFPPAQHQPEDIGGYPIPDLERKWVNMLPVGETLRELIRVGRGIFFCDEWTSVAPSMQAAMLKVINERRWGHLVLPMAVVPVSACNPVELAANGHQLSAAAANRWDHFPWNVHLESVQHGFMAQWPELQIPILPKGWRTGIPGKRALLASFFRVFPSLMQACPKEESKQSGAWPSIRTYYDFVAPTWAAAESVGAGEDVMMSLFCAAIGEGAAGQLWPWARNLDMPDPEDCLKDQSKFAKQLEENSKVNRIDKNFAMLNSIVAAVCSRMTPERWSAAWDIFALTAKMGQGDIAAAAVRALLANKKAGMPRPTKQQTEAFIPILKAAGRMD